jgi:hypothetical protein
MSLVLVDPKIALRGELLAVTPGEFESRGWSGR